MSAKPLFSNVVIVGVGLLGASLGLALKKFGLAGKVIGVGRAGSASLGVALARGAIDSAETELEKACRENGGAELVVLCTPVRQFSSAMKTLRGVLKAGAVVTDVGSTKREVMGWAAEIFAGSEIEFVGSHPMAGSEKRGPEHARPELFERALCLICAGEGTQAEGAASRVEAMWKGVGMSTVRMTPAEHDATVARVSHLPHATAFALMTAAGKNPEMLKAAAGGFLDTTRIAAGDVEMWTDIFLTNRAAVVEAIDLFAGELGKLKTAIAGGDEGALREMLTKAKEQRDALTARKIARRATGEPPS